MKKHNDDHARHSSKNSTSDRTQGGQESATQVCKLGTSSNKRAPIKSTKLPKSETLPEFFDADIDPAVSMVTDGEIDPNDSNKQLHPEIHGHQTTNKTLHKNPDKEEGPDFLASEPTKAVVPIATGDTLSPTSLTTIRNGGRKTSPTSEPLDSTRIPKVGPEHVSSHHPKLKHGSRCESGPFSEHGRDDSHYSRERTPSYERDFVSDDNHDRKHESHRTPKCDPASRSRLRRDTTSETKYEHKVLLDTPKLKMTLICDPKSPKFKKVIRGSKDRAYCNRVSKNLNSFMDRQVFDCPFIAKLFQVHLKRHDLVIVMEYLAGGDLFSAIYDGDTPKSSLTRRDKIFYIQEIILALDHMHSRKVIYGDLKPENIVVAPDGHIKLVDFETMEYFPEKGEKIDYNKIGTDSYNPPEFFKGGRLSDAHDMWALGILMHEICIGYHPLQTKDKHLSTKTYRKLMVNLKNEQIRIRTSNRYLKHLLRNLLKVNPQNRLTIQEVKNHAFFRKTNWTDVLKKRYPPPFIPVLKNIMDTAHLPRFIEDDYDEDLYDE